MSGPKVVIAGGGLAGSLAALVLAERRRDVSVLLVEQSERFGGNHVWSFFDSDVEAADRPLLDALVLRRWEDHAVEFPRRRRRLAFGYNSIRSEGLDRLVRERLRPDQYRLSRRIEAVAPDHVLLEGGERIEADGVIDARGPVAMPGLDLAWQKFVGRTYRCGSAHGCMRPVIMDARVDQATGYRFVYTLPFSENELMVEDTYYSTSPVLDVPLVGCRIDAYVARKGWPDVTPLAQETGVLPVALGGDVASLWNGTSPPVALLGLRGGFFHPTTGYSLPDALRNAVLLARQSDVSSAALHGLFRRRAQDLWAERSFYRLLNRMLFRAAEPSRRYRVLEHFYRLPEQLIARFYAGRSTAFDKLRILSGRPPVPLGRALAAIGEQAS